MISRDNIIRTALLKCGEISTYNDNRSEIYAIASKLLDNVIDNLAIRIDLLFNSVTSKLTKNGINELGENRFNIPIDFLSKVRFVNSIARIESEYVYSNSDDVYLQYCRRVNLDEYPNYLFDYMCYSLAIELAETVNTYSDRLQLLNLRKQEEDIKLLVTEYTPIVRKI